MDNVSALRDLFEGRTPSRARAQKEDDPEGDRERAASSYIGDVLDSLHASGHLTKDEVDDAAAVIANNAAGGPEAVVMELIKKGLIPGGRLMGGGHRKLRERVRGAMGEAAGDEILESVRSSMNEKQRSFAERVEKELRASLGAVLRAEGLAALDADHVMSSVRHRVRGAANKAAFEATKKGVRPIRS